MSRLFDRSNVKKIVIHHLGNKKGPLFSREALLQAANPDGWEYSDYDYGILGDGTVIDMRPLSVIGAHTQASHRYNYSPNWWNRNSAGIVIANDCEMFPPTPLQMQALVRFLFRWLETRGLNMDAAYPHFQVTQTKCPGASYHKLGLDTGFMDYDAVESEVNSLLAGGTLGGIEIMKLIVAYTKDDMEAAGYLADAVRGAIINKDYLTEARVDVLYQVGGPDLYQGKAVLLSGGDKYDTARAVLDFIAKGV